MIEFEAFPKLSRLARECVVTEKLDGTNAQIIIKRLPEERVADGEVRVTIPAGEGSEWTLAANAAGDLYMVAAGSRTRLIRPGKSTDNYSFAAWVFDNARELVKLGEGRHFGEWWGQGIQRGYGLSEKRFSLFNTDRWDICADNACQEFTGRQLPPPCCGVVPELYRGPFDTTYIRHVLGVLSALGSKAAPGFRDPEGIVVYHTHARTSFKMTYDDRHKEAA